MSPTSNDVLCFFAQSADKPPGQGANEHVANPLLYTGLAARPHWRRVLSNFHVCPFVYNGKTYRTIEHAFQAAKIRLADPAAASRFTVESGTDLGARGDGLAARKQRKMVHLSRDVIAQWDQMSGAVMAQIAAAKYAQCAEARQVLLLTNDAQLWHVAPRMGRVQFEHLEGIRLALRDLAMMI